MGLVVRVAELKLDQELPELEDNEILHEDWTPPNVTQIWSGFSSLTAISVIVFDWGQYGVILDQVLPPSFETHNLFELLNPSTTYM